MVLTPAINKLSGLLVRAVGPFVVLFGHTLVLFVTYLYFALPLLPSNTKAIIYYPWTLFGIYILFNILFNWDACMLTDPGSPPAYSKVVEDGIKNVPVCKKCLTTKPARAHHCSVSLRVKLRF